MGLHEGFRMESDKYVYFYEKKQGACEDTVWQIADKKTKQLLPFSIVDDLRGVNFMDRCNFCFSYNLDELSEKERQSEKLMDLAYDILKDFILGEHYYQHELEVYKGDLLENALDPYGGCRNDDDFIKSLYEQFVEEVDNMTIEEEDFLETKEARESRQDRNKKSYYGFGKKIEFK